MYRMNESTVDLLERIQGRLSDQLVQETVQETAVAEDEGELSKGKFAFDEHTVSHLEKIRGHLNEFTTDEVQEVESDFEDDVDVEDALNNYLDDIADALIDMGYDEDEAVDLVLDVADEMAEDGLMPPLPDEDAPLEDVALWLGTAATVGFGPEVMAAA